MTDYDDEGYEVYVRPPGHYRDRLEPGVIYPGGAHVTWARTAVRVPYWVRFVGQPYVSEPKGAADARRQHRAEDRKHVKAGDRLRPINSADPWSEVQWVPGDQP